MSSRRDCSAKHVSTISDSEAEYIHTNAQVCVDGCVASRARQVLVLTVWDVEVSLGVTVLLGKTEINDIDLVTTLADAHEEIVRLDVTVDKGLGVNVFDT
jgi:hypothetical protein